MWLKRYVHFHGINITQILIYVKGKVINKKKPVAGFSLSAYCLFNSLLTTGLTNSWFRATASFIADRRISYLLPLEARVMFFLKAVNASALFF